MADLTNAPAGALWVAYYAGSRSDATLAARLARSGVVLARLALSLHPRLFFVADSAPADELAHRMVDIALADDGTGRNKMIAHRTDCPDALRQGDNGEPVMTMYGCQRFPPDIARHSCLDGIGDWLADGTDT